MTKHAALFPRNFKKDLPIAVRGEGSWIFTADGRRLLDASGQAAVVSIGHGVAEIGRAMAELKASGAPPWLGYVVALVMTAILAIALSWVIQATGPQTAARGAAIAAALWFGFVFTSWATEYAFEARGISILAINTGYPLAGMLLMGLVLGGWKAKPRAA